MSKTSKENHSKGKLRKKKGKKGNHRVGKGRTISGICVDKDEKRMVIKGLASIIIKLLERFAGKKNAEETKQACLKGKS